VINGIRYDYSGRSVSTAGDFNGDALMTGANYAIPTVKIALAKAMWYSGRIESFDASLNLA